MTERAGTLAAVGDVLRSADLLVEERGPGDVALRGVAQDSRLVEPGDLFVAWKGGTADAHDFAAAAVDAGAVGLVVERPLDVSAPQLVVRDGRRAAALAAESVLGWPSRAMVAIGITGTNGKTTTAHLVRHLLADTMRTAVIGTLGLVDDDGVRPGTEGLTTPGPVQVAVWLRDLADGGTEAVVLEASSHALEQARLDGVRFQVGVFTNLTQDHLDYHGDMERYRAAKLRLLDLVAPDGVVVVNRDEPAWAEIEVGRRHKTTFGIDGTADVCAFDVELGAGGSEFMLRVDGEPRRVGLPLIGRYNVENALAAVATVRALGLGMDEIVHRLGTSPPVPGRLEPVVARPFTVLIDFAHTPAALEGALRALRPLTEGRLIVLFGAGGDRDRTKRAPMAAAAGRLADFVVITSDNPRTEDPEAIIDEVAVGIGEVPYLRQVDRREAIHAALAEARAGDTVLLAGKGHESYQVVGTEKRPFDERAIVLEALAAMGVA